MCHLGKLWDDLKTTSWSYIISWLFNPAIHLSIGIHSLHTRFFAKWWLYTRYWWSWIFHGHVDCLTSGLFYTFLKENFITWFHELKNMYTLTMVTNILRITKLLTFCHITLAASSILSPMSLYSPLYLWKNIKVICKAYFK